jgi:hypothetical protein
MKQINLPAEVVERDSTPETWAVEAIDVDGDGDVYVSLFSGPKARARAVEYAEEKYAAVKVRT